MPSTTRLIAPIAIALTLAAGACKEKNNGPNLSQDSSLTRDLQMANADTAAQPQLTDTATSPSSTTQPAPAPAPTPSRPRTTTPRPRPTPAPAPRPAPPPAPTTTASGNTVERGTAGSEGALATIPSGTALNLTSNDKVCTNTNHVGDRFTATVTEPVTGTNGATIPAGAKVVLKVTELKRSENANDPIRMTFDVVSVSYNDKSYPITASIDNVDVQRVRNSSTGNDAKKVAGGAIAGAILGQVLGHNTKSTVIGAAAGAAAGTAVAMGTANYEGCIPQGGAIKIHLTQPATITAE